MTDDVHATIEGAARLVAEAASANVHVACLPEHWLLEHRVTAESLIPQFQEWARQHRIWLIPGANYTKQGDTLQIESVLISPGGEVVGRQSKVHLFRQEKERAHPGASYSVLDIDDLKIGIIVCYDNVFPEVARILAVRGADVLFLPSRIVAEGLEPWRLYILTRALENRIPIVAPNVYAPPAFPGGSIVVDVEEKGNGRVVIPRVVRDIGSGTGVAVYDIDVERTRQLRKERIFERRPDTYRSLLS